MNKKAFYIVDIALFIFLFTITINSFLSTFLKHKIVHLIEEKSEGMNTLQINSFRINLLTQNIKMNGIMIIRRDGGSSIFEAGSINVYNINVTKFFRKNKFQPESIQLRELRLNNLDSLYNMYVDKAVLSTSPNRVSFEKFRLLPLYDKKTFSLKAGKQTDRFVILMDKLELADLDIDALFESYSLFSKSARIDSLIVYAYRDRNIRRIEEDVEFMQQKIHNAGFRFSIDTLKFYNSFVQYEELSPPQTKAGRMTFENISASLKNLSNISNDSSLKMIFNADANLNGKSTFRTQIEMPLNSNGFSSEASASNIKMKDMNAMIESEVRAVFTDGTIDSLHFNVTSDSSHLNGKLTMIYHNLKIAAKDVEENSTEKTTLKIKSLIINEFFIHENNPEHGKEIRKAETYRPYNKKRFMINNIWKSILEGVKESIKK